MALSEDYLSWGKPKKKFKRFVDKIDPYNKILWQRNLLASKKTCSRSMIGDFVVDSRVTTLLKDIEDPTNCGEMLSKKLKMCQTVFDFSRNSMNKEKQIKKKILSEILEYLIHGIEVLKPEIYHDIILMVRCNLFRKLPESKESLDFEDKHYAKEPSWPHLNLVYEIFLQFLQLPEFKISPARLYINEEFIDELINLFHSEDANEGLLLKDILLEIYKTFVVLRSHIRNKLYDFCWRYVFESKFIAGLPNLLEFYSSVIAGFVTPLETEHVLFYKNVFLKLHACFMFPAYFSQFVDCLYEFLLKDASLYDGLVKAIVMYWPKTSSKKQILFLNELNDLLTDISDDQFVVIMVPLFKQLSKAMTSSNHFVTEAVLDLLHNTHICSLIYKYHKVVMPIILPSLIKASFDTTSPDKNRVNMTMKRYQHKLQDNLFDALNKNAAEIDEANKVESQWQELWSRVDVIEKELSPYIQPVVVEREIINEDKDISIISVSHENQFSIFPSNPPLFASDFSTGLEESGQESLHKGSDSESVAEEVKDGRETSKFASDDKNISDYELRLASISEGTAKEFGQVSVFFDSSDTEGQRWSNIIGMSRLILQWMNKRSSSPPGIESQE